MEYSPSLRSECMVLPYLKGLINKESFHIISGFICIILYFLIRSIISWVRSTTSGIRATTEIRFSYGLLELLHEGLQLELVDGVVFS